MFTGLKAKKMIGATSKDVKRPTLKKYRVFVQNGGGDTRCLKKGTRLLYEVNNKTIFHYIIYNHNNIIYLTEKLSVISRVQNSVMT